MIYIGCDMSFEEVLAQLSLIDINRFSDKVLICNRKYLAVASVGVYVHSIISDEEQLLDSKGIEYLAEEINAEEYEVRHCIENSIKHPAFTLLELRRDKTILAMQSILDTAVKVYNFRDTLVELWLDFEEMDGELNIFIENIGVTRGTFMNWIKGYSSE